MFSEWLKEQWYDIKFAHKSLWASIVCISLAASALVWECADHRYAGEIAMRDEYIRQLTTQNVQLRAIVTKYAPKQLGTNSSTGSLSDQAQDKMYEMQNNLNNMNTGVQDQVQQMNDTVTNVQNGINNGVNNAQTDADTAYRKSKQRAYETVVR